MKKSLIALAVISAFAAQAAMAETTIYGQMNLSVDDVANGAVNNSASAMAMGSNTSRLGLKGSEDLGDGMSAIWQIESTIGLSSTGAAAAANTSVLGNRDTFVGLSSSSMGTLLGGRHDTPYKMATRGYDLFADGIADNRSIMGGAALHDARVDNALAYVSPTFGGVTIVGAGVFGSSTPMANSTKANVWSLAALYAGGPFTGTFAYQTIQFGSAGTGTFGAAGNAPANLIGGNVYALAVNDKTTAWKIGGSYTMDAFLINAVYEKVTFTPNAAGTDQLDQGDWYVAGKYSVSANDAVKLAFTEAGTQTKVNNGSNNGAKQWTVGYDHNMSKHTTVYALYSKLTNDSGADYTFNQGTSAASANGGVGSAPSVFSIGMKHAF